MEHNVVILFTIYDKFLISDRNCITYRRDTRKSLVGWSESCANIYISQLMRANQYCK